MNPGTHQRLTSTAFSRKKTKHDLDTIWGVQHDKYRIVYGLHRGSICLVAIAGRNEVYNKTVKALRGRFRKVPRA